MIRRLVVLIGTQATLEAQVEASLKQAKSASDHSRQLMDQLSGQKTQGRDALNDENEGNKKLEKQETEIRKLKEELALSKEELIKYRVNCDSMKKQAEAVSEEYDRLLVEHDKLQVWPFVPHKITRSHSALTFTSTAGVQQIVEHWRQQERQMRCQPFNDLNIIKLEFIQILITFGLTRGFS